MSLQERFLKYVSVWTTSEEDREEIPSTKRQLDLAQILSKIMQKNDWDKQILYNLIQEYDKKRVISQDEMRLLKFLMTYPDKYNSICLKYMSSKRRWNYSMFEQKWLNMLSYRDKQIEVANMIQTW